MSLYFSLQTLYVANSRLMHETVELNTNKKNDILIISLTRLR